MLFLWLIPFLLLLLSIALLPLLCPKFAKKISNQVILIVILCLPVIFYLLPAHAQSLANSLHEYLSFITLSVALFTISGGIYLEGDLPPTPWVNTTFLLIGALLANLLGTMGASILLIRPFLQTNQRRKNTKHLPLFFIMIVSNIGGLLLPVGPPLFLGYLKGVPFLWTLKALSPLWLFSVGFLLLLFFFIDSLSYKQERVENLKVDTTQIVPLKIKGLFNFILFGGVILALFLPSPYLEGAMILLTLISLFGTSPLLRQKNNFSFKPILEVALLFLGIFITMVPALELMKSFGPHLGITKPYQFFWFSGLLSSFLDNTPTYLTFFTLGQSLPLSSSHIAGLSEPLLRALSAGAQCMGAMTYIGNGPNFIVKTLAEQAGIKTPSFFGYILYSICILFPLFIGLTLLFFV